jgi:CarD family transcriptional regulator
MAAKRSGEGREMATKKSVTAAKIRAAARKAAKSPAKAKAPAKSPVVMKGKRDAHKKTTDSKAKIEMKNKTPALKLAASKPAPARPTMKPTMVKPVPVKPVPVKVAEPKPVELVFDKGDFVVYPTHGVGRVVDIEARQIAGHKLDLFVISFEQDRMTLRVPVAKAKVSGLRKLSSRKIMDSALTTLKGRSRISRAMWNRRAQEYEAKINSGDPVSIAEVVRDLHRNAGQPDQSYSERQIYEAALDRLARELAAVERIDKDSATQKLQGVLSTVLKQAA